MDIRQHRARDSTATVVKKIEIHNDVCREQQILKGLSGC